MEISIGSPQSVIFSGSRYRAKIQHYSIRALYTGIFSLTRVFDKKKKKRKEKRRKEEEEEKREC